MGFMGTINGHLSVKLAAGDDFFGILKILFEFT